MKIRNFLFPLSLFALACTTEQSTAPDAEVRFARGGNGGGNGGSTTIAPVRLDDPRKLGCSSTEGFLVYSATPTRVIGSCTRTSGIVSPYLWTSGAGGSVLELENAWVRGLTTDGTMFGEVNGSPFFQTVSGFATLLPMPTANPYGDVYDVTPNGETVVGAEERPTPSGWVQIPLVWTRAGTGPWGIEALPGVGNAVSASGQTIAGAYSGHAAIFERSGGPFEARTLPDGGAISSRALGINEDGTVVVGARSIPLTLDPTGSYEEHVAWILDAAGGWTLKVLGGLNVGEGRAYSAEYQTDGRLLVVGYSWEDKNGPNEQLWAVAWRQTSGSWDFDAPIRLEPITKGASAIAYSVNSKGEIVGTAWTRKSTVAVMWKM